MQTYEKFCDFLKNLTYCINFFFHKYIYLKLRYLKIPFFSFFEKIFLLLIKKNITLKRNTVKKYFLQSYEGKNIIFHLSVHYFSKKGESI